VSGATRSPGPRAKLQEPAAAKGRKVGAGLRQPFLRGGGVWMCVWEGGGGTTTTTTTICAQTASRRYQYSPCGSGSFFF
jgi:hypothetical protein